MLQLTVESNQVKDGPMLELGLFVLFPMVLWFNIIRTFIRLTFKSLEFEHNTAAYSQNCSINGDGLSHSVVLMV